MTNTTDMTAPRYPWTETASDWEILSRVAYFHGVVENTDEFTIAYPYCETPYATSPLDKQMADHLHATVDWATNGMGLDPVAWDQWAALVRVRPEGFGEMELLEDGGLVARLLAEADAERAPHAKAEG